MKLLDKFVFDFFQTLAFRFRQAAPYEDAAGEADDAIEPERPGCAQSAVQHREGVRQDEAGGPKGEGTYRHGYAPYAVGEYFGDDDPHGRSQCHGVAGDGGHHDDEQHDSADMEPVGRAHEGVNQRQAKRPEEGQGFASPTVYHAHG